MAKIIKTQVAFVTIDDLTAHASASVYHFKNIENVTWQCVRDKEIVMSSGVVILLWNDKSKILKSKY